ncbi:MAG: SAVED domain-containing protein [Planctomycetes bacterium]|nr:SAVED domain-containing protein [Planctomycetota bacterium]
MSHTSVPDKTKLHLWVLAGGRCQYRGCNDELWRDNKSQAWMNRAYVAHITADKPKGPRGHRTLSTKLRKALSNLMLLCDAHHRRIDTDVAGHPVELLQGMKAEHEARIETLTAISPDLGSHVLLYGTNIGDHASMLTYEDAAQAMVPKRYPATATPIRLDMIDSGTTDRDPAFWSQEEANLLKKFDVRVRQVVADGTVRHLSVFARAPQPLLIRLGTLLTDIAPADIYQLHREPNAGWAWPKPAPPAPAFRFIPPPNDANGPAALIVSLSATVTNDRIAKVLGKRFAPWRIELSKPRHDCIGAPEHLSKLRALLRRALDQIKAKHGADAPLHIFPAAPVSTMVELGRVRQPKADMAWHIYDENRAHGGFINAMQIAQEK